MKSKSFLRHPGASNFTEEHEQRLNQRFHLRRYPADVDDIGILLCAINGHATHLVSYDGGFEPFVGEFAFSICESLAFLAELRAAVV